MEGIVHSGSRVEIEWKLELKDCPNQPPHHSDLFSTKTKHRNYNIIINAPLCTRGHLQTIFVRVGGRGRGGLDDDIKMLQRLSAAVQRGNAISIMSGLLEGARDTNT